MSMKFVSLLGALAVASPAFGITVNITDFTFAPPDAVSVRNSTSGLAFTGAAGQFSGALDSGAAALAFGARPAAPLANGSFTAYCAQLDQDIAFNITYDYGMASGASYFAGTKAADLSRLFTAAQSLVVDSAVSAAMQAAVWEIIYEQGPSYDLSTGNFLGTPSNPADQGAFDTINSFLMNLGQYSASYQIDVLTNSDRQDLLVATAAIPEPGTWALFGAGLVAIGLMARRRRA